MSTHQVSLTTIPPRPQISTLSMEALAPLPLRSPPKSSQAMVSTTGWFQVWFIIPTFRRDQVGRASCSDQTMNLKSGDLKKGRNSEWSSNASTIF